MMKAEPARGRSGTMLTRRPVWPQQTGITKTAANAATAQKTGQSLISGPP